MVKFRAMELRKPIPVGARFGRLVVIGDGGRNPGNDHHRLWLCRCDCGAEKAVLPSSLRRGKSASCGCLRHEFASARLATHGLSKTPEYETWGRLRQRCTNPKHPDYPDYGGRGIRVCERWDSFENFLADMGPRPSRRYSIDRKDVNGDYAPENCRWATIRQQSRNKRNNVWIEHDGKRMILEDWAKETGLPRTTLEQRVWRGWPDDLVVTAPHGYRPKAGRVVEQPKHRTRS